MKDMDMEEGDRIIDKITDAIEPLVEGLSADDLTDVVFASALGLILVETGTSRCHAVLDDLVSRIEIVRAQLDESFWDGLMKPVAVRAEPPQP